MVKRDARYILIRDCLKRHYREEQHHRIEQCLKELELILDEKYHETMLPGDELKLLSKYGLSKYIVSGLRRRGIETLADLKGFIICDQSFRDSGVLSISGIGSGATREFTEKLPMFKEFCESLGLEVVKGGE